MAILLDILFASCGDYVGHLSHKCFHYGIANAFLMACFVRVFISALGLPPFFPYPPRSPCTVTPLLLLERSVSTQAGHRCSLCPRTRSPSHPDDRSSQHACHVDSRHCSALEHWRLLFLRTWRCAHFVNCHHRIRPHLNDPHRDRRLSHARLTHRGILIDHGIIHFLLTTSANLVVCILTILQLSPITLTIATTPASCVSIMAAARLYVSLHEEARAQNTGTIIMGR